MAPMTQYQSQRARASPWTPRHRWCLPRPSPEPLPFLTPSGTEFAQKTRVAQEWGRGETEEERGGCCRQGEEQALQQRLGLSGHSGGTSHLLPLLPNVHNVCSQENINRRDFFSVYFKKWCYSMISFYICLHENSQNIKINLDNLQPQLYYMIKVITMLKVQGTT